MLLKNIDASSPALKPWTVNMSTTHHDALRMVVVTCYYYQCVIGFILLFCHQYHQHSKECLIVKLLMTLSVHSKMGHTLDD